MFGRLLGFLGFIPGLSGYAGLASGYGSGTATEEGMDADGEAAVSFTPGQRLSSADTEETPGSKQDRITERDLVWPGRVETIHISNPEPIMYRFDLTVTDLNPAFYLRRQPKGGLPQREGGILLQPGEEASFDVAFVPPPAGEKMKTRTFSFVLTAFDPRRSSEPGEIVQDLPLCWVALPSESDLQISAVPPVVVTRPWRREARFAVQFANKSFLPPLVSLTILRAPTKDALQKDAETVGTIQQSLAARTPGVWQCLLPPPPRRASYYATISGSAQAAEEINTPLVLPRPVLIRYIPWLRLGRDWAVLIGSLLLLFWLVWGIPVRKTPVVRASVAFAGLNAGQMPADSQLKDLSAQMILLDERGHDLEGQQPIPGAVINKAFEFSGPTRTFGFHWPFGQHHGWNPWSREKQHFRITVAPQEAEKNAFKHYDLNALQAAGTPAYSAEDSVTPFGSLVVPATVTVPAVPRVLVSLSLGHLGALAHHDLHRVSVRYTLDGEEQPAKTFEVLHSASGGLRPITLDLTDAIPLGSSKRFAVKVTANGLSSDDIEEIEVERHSQPLPIVLTFPDFYPSKPASTQPKPLVVPGKIAGAPGKPTGTPGKIAGTPAKPTGTPGKIAGTPGKIAGTPGKPIGTPGQPAGTGGTVPPPITQQSHSQVSVPPVPRTGTQTTGPLPTIHTKNANLQIPIGGPRVVVSPPPGPPATPAGLVARAAGPTQINVSWDPVLGADKYILYRSGGRGATQGPWTILVPQTSFADAGLTPGGIYRYAIQSKRGHSYSSQSKRVSLLAPAVVVIPVTAQLAVTAQGKNLDAVLNFVNVSKRNVYLDKISACDGGRIGDDVFRVSVDGQNVPFSGRKSGRLAHPGPRQFITLLPGEQVHESVKLNQAYRLPSGAHTYSVVYSGPHVYPDRLQAFTLTSNDAQLKVF